MTAGGVRRFAPWLVALSGYAALTVVVMWPVVTHLSSAFPHDPYDPALNAWILWWNAHTMPLTERWRNAPMFWPMPDALSLSEHLVGISVLTTPLQWAGLRPLTAYNLALLASYPLSALAAHALAFVIVKRHDAATLAGLIFGFNPYRVAQLPHLQMLWAFGMPLALFALHRHLEGKRRAWLALFALAWVMQSLGNGYYLLFFPVLLACWVLWFTVGRSRADTLAIAGVWIAASLALAPFLWTYLRIQGALNLERGLDEMEAFSADAIGLIAASPDMIVWHGLSKWSRPEGELFPGALALAIVIIGAAVAWKTRRAPPDAVSRFRAGRLALTLLTAIVIAIALSPLVLGPWQLSRGGSVLLSVSSAEKPLSIALLFTAILLLTSRALRRLWRRGSAFTFYTLAAVLMFILSLGPRAKFAGTPVIFRAPYYWLLQVPGFTGVRAPGRFGMLFVLCLAVAAALAFGRLTSALTRRMRYIAAAAASVVIVAESWPTTAAIAAPPPIRALERADAAAPVLELPAGITERDTAALYRSIVHGRPVINGYSGYVPPHYRVFTVGLRLDDGAVLTELARNGPLTVAIDRREELDRWVALVAQCHGELVADDGEWRVYRVPGVERAAQPAGGAPLAIRAVDANVGADWVSRMLDGNPRTEWNSRRVQAGGEEVVIDLGAERFVSAVRLIMGLFNGDFPRRLVVECAGERGEWQRCWSGSAARLALRAALEDSHNVPMTIPIGLDHVRRLRLRQTGVDPMNPWSIAELAVLGR